MKKLTLGILIVVALTGLTWSTYRLAPAQDSIQIGAILILSNENAIQGENSQKGIELAVREINAAGGVLGKQITVVYQDNRGDNPKEAVNAFYNLIHQNIHLVIGPNQTPSGSALAPLAVPNDALLLAPSIGSEKFAAESSNTFNVRPADQAATFGLAEYLYHKGYKKIALFGSKQEWEEMQSRYFKQKFEELGGTITDMELPLVDNKDLKIESLKIKASNPEVIVFTNWGETSIAARRLHDLSVTTPFYSTVLDEPEIKNALGALEGTISVSTYGPRQDFIDKFKATYSVAPDFPADTAYDAVTVLAEAIRRAGSTKTSEVVKALNTIHQWNGASGDFTFDEAGNVTRPATFFIVKGDHSIPYNPI